MRRDHLDIQYGIDLYPYQELISDRILAALLNNLNVETEKDLETLELEELAIEISRQAGKTEAVANTVAFIMTFVSEQYGIPIHIGLFAPQIEQARTDFDRIKNKLRPIKDLIVQDDEQKQNVKEKENAKTLVLPNGSSVWIAPVTTTSKPESKTFHIMIFEEAQDMDDKILKEQIFPIGATTNAPRIFVGTAGTKLCYYRKLGQKHGAIKIYFDDVVKQRREIYDRTGEIKHLIYERTVTSEIGKHGIDADEIQRPYFGKWLIGTGQFTTEEELRKLDEDRNITFQEKTSMCFAGIDVAKHPDSTVVTILRWNEEKKKKQVINWLELRGENYEDQFEIIQQFLGNYRVVAIAIDSTGVGDPVTDMFVKRTQFVDEDSGLYAIKFTQQSKDNMYRNLKISIKELLTGLPKLDIKKSSKFVEQMLDLQQEYKGQFLSVSHPDSPNAHDDYPDSWALAEWAFARYMEENNVGIVWFEDKKEEKKVERDGKGKITDTGLFDDHWED